MHSQDVAFAQSIGVLLAMLLCSFLWVEKEYSSKIEWKITAMVAIILGAPGMIHLLYFMYRNII